MAVTRHLLTSLSFCEASDPGYPSSSFLGAPEKESTVVLVEGMKCSSFSPLRNEPPVTPSPGPQTITSGSGGGEKP